MADEIGESRFDKFVDDKEQEVLKNTLVRKIDKEFIKENFVHDYDLPAMEGANYLSD